MRHNQIQGFTESLMAEDVITCTFTLIITYSVRIITTNNYLFRILFWSKHLSKLWTKIRYILGTYKRCQLYFEKMIFLNYEPWYKNKLQECPNLECLHQHIKQSEACIFYGFLSLQPQYLIFKTGKSFH